MGAASRSIFFFAQQNKPPIYTCICASGWTGVHCEVQAVDDACAPEPCQNGGNCTSLLNNDYACTCPDEFSGQNCSVRVSKKGTKAIY